MSSLELFYRVFVQFILYVEYFPVVIYSVLDNQTGLYYANTKFTGSTLFFLKEFLKLLEKKEFLQG